MKSSVQSPDSDCEFDLFSPLSPSEISYLSSRSAQVNREVSTALSLIPTLPRLRSPAQSRQLFVYKRHSLERGHPIHKYSSLLSNEECSQVLKILDSYVSSFHSIAQSNAQSLESTLPSSPARIRSIPSPWTTSRHTSYPTTDIPVSSIPPLDSFLSPIVTNRILPTIAEHYGFNKGELYVKDLFVVKYQVSVPTSASEDEISETTKDLQSELEMHTDGSLISFNVLLNQKSQFVGGGTVFQGDTSVVSVSENSGSGCLQYKEEIIKCSSLDRTTISIQQGDAVFHDSKRLHGGNKITSGQRLILVGFLDSVR
ncbi:hypothetical protein BKA69DRAFT_1054394 [Paraphysoderma sedebokerense]|nr:hypothetical protein BKA69DRAFT_1054394 [Paraphysoderma sedebokerense]